MQNDDLNDSVFSKRDPSALRFSEEQEARLKKWFDAGKPGEPHDWLGISKAEYEAIRESLRAWAHEVVASPWVSRMLARSFALRIEAQTRWEDDGGPSLPEWFLPTTGAMGQHRHPRYTDIHVRDRII